MIAILCAWLALQATPEPVFSGPQPGEPTPSFQVQALNGPDQNQTVDYVERWGGAPSLFIFLHDVTRPAGRLVKLLDEWAAKQSRVKVLLVSLNDDVLQGELNMPRTLNSLRFASTCGVSVDGKEGPGSWGLNRDMALTIVLAKEGKVLANWPLASPNETDFERIRAEAEKVAMPALETIEELRAELLRQDAEIAALRAELEGLKLRVERGSALGRGAAGAPAAPEQPAPRGGRGGGGMDAGGMDAPRPSDAGPGAAKGGMGAEGSSSAMRAEGGAQASGSKKNLAKDNKKKTHKKQAKAEQKKQRAKESPLESRMPTDPGLTALLGPLADRGASDAEVDAAVASIDAYLAEHAGLEAELRDAVAWIDAFDLGTPHAKAARAKYVEPADAELSGEGAHTAPEGPERKL